MKKILVFFSLLLAGLFCFYWCKTKEELSRSNHSNNP